MYGEWVNLVIVTLLLLGGDNNRGCVCVRERERERSHHLLPLATVAPPKTVFSVALLVPPSVGALKVQV